ncbi:mitogen-activated protein kinase 13 [Callorhinchus milii]|uniref:mitogen-activated protein kinase n=1 Tax=Callorhinchus milii TaxID=7868 RepID=A0A4W3GI61_CALMI|nr:mitogen-activated protein kinase 13 [Callorhinchus milii]XP_007892451.1 mitogen-activated protein kinase 13 [Callorhinchus milii]|eukprot:gi/632953496/ref/XP_007892449.1/ PREDICTED: mitogen-activated protein kinase 13-like [Callorhinchus milii]
MSFTRRGFYRHEIKNTVWDVPDNYVNMTPIGSGAYGTVCSATDKRTGTKVAIKKLYRPFQSEIYAKRAYRELKLLKHMKHENVIGLLDVYTPAVTLGGFRNFYLVMPFMDADLEKIMGKLTEDRIQFLVYQILKGLKYIHSAGIIHRDLKPGNLAITKDCELKIIDFGLARQADLEMTGYVVTRWYRAPEVILNWMRYTQTVDVWSVGCILAEMITGKILFKGKDYLDQLAQIMKVTGTPGPDFIQKLDGPEARRYIRTQPYIKKKDFSLLFSNASPLAVDLLEKMLVLDSDNRLSATEALSHPYFEPYREPGEETESEPFDDSLDHLKLSVDQWKRHTFHAVMSFIPLSCLEARLKESSF